MRRGFIVPTLNKDYMFYRKVACVVETKSEPPEYFEIFNIIGKEVYQKFCVTNIIGNPLDIFIEVNAN